MYKFEKLKTAPRVVIAIALMTILMSVVAIMFIGLFTAYSAVDIFEKAIIIPIPVIVVGFGVLSGIICYMVYNPLADMILSRLGSGKKTKASNGNTPSIVLPKLYDEESEEEKDDSAFD